MVKEDMKIYKESGGWEESIYIDMNENVVNKKMEVSLFLIMKENRWL